MTPNKPINITYFNSNQHHFLRNEREEFRDKVCDSEGNVRGIGLQSCLLKPFQRLTRLPLLFEPLKNAGEPVMPAISAITKVSPWKLINNKTYY